jgi:hypothetical protein
VNDGDAAAIIAALEATSSRSKLTKLATVIYECETRGCAMLYVFNNAGRLYIRQSRHKLSDPVNRQESVPDARAKHTIDGDRHWQGQAFELSQADGYLSLECDHCRAKRHVDTIAADVAAATRQPTTITVPNGDVR